MHINKINHTYHIVEYPSISGIPAAFVAINTVNRLCDLMLSENSQVRGCTAIALAFLSFNHKAERELLNRYKGL